MELVAIFSTITAALTTVEKGAQLAKRLAGTKGGKIADHGVQLIEMRSALLDAKSALLDSQTALQDQEREVARLREAFESKDKVVRVRDACYSVGESGKPYGEALCLHCYQGEQRLRYLIQHPTSSLVRICTVCQQEYYGRNTYLFASEADDGEGVG